MLSIEKLATEQRNPASMHIDEVSTLEMLHIINQEDQKVPQTIAEILPSIAHAVDCIADRLSKGGRLFYIGAGTSGRLGILDAVECPPTYGTPSDFVQGLIAGGSSAFFKAREGAEDSAELGQQDLIAHHFSSRDVLVGIAASGRTPYVLGAMQYAKNLLAATISIACSPNSPLAALADFPLTAVVGPEVVTGSTRMKAGTAQKLILNMLSTGTMIRLGKVYGNLMVDLKTSNKKLEERARHIVMNATDCSYEESVQALRAAGGQAKTAIFMLLSGLPRTIAEAKLQAAKGYIAKALK